MPDVSMLAEESGFFNAEEIDNDDGTVDYDRSYTSEQFSEYFALFIGNGVFINPTNQLLVSSLEGSVGLKVKVNAGWSFINGMWYHNKEDGELELEQNTTTTVRVDGIFCRFSKADRSIKVIVGKGRTQPKRLEYDWELMLATVNVVSGAIKISNSNITDTRPNEEVCGFVKGLLDVIATQDLFNQFNALFHEWFDYVKEQFGDDAVGSMIAKTDNLQAQIDELESKEAVNELTVFLQQQIDAKAPLVEFNNLVNKVNGKANLSSVINMELLASSWTGDVIPFTSEISISGVSSDTIVEVGISSSATTEQVKEWFDASVIGGNQGVNFITLKSYGFKPSVNIPIVIIVRGDV